MTFPELQIQLDLNPDNRIDVLKNVDTCRITRYGYLFVDQKDGQCYLFNKNGNLDDIRKVKEIRYEAFYDCTSLTSIKLLSSVESIRSWAFTYCSSLKSIKIPNSVKIIGTYAFAHCKSLKEVIFEKRTIDEVKVMDGYPWGIKDKSVIKVENEQSLDF